MSARVAAEPVHVEDDVILQDRCAFFRDRRSRRQRVDLLLRAIFAIVRGRGRRPRIWLLITAHTE